MTPRNEAFGLLPLGKTLDDCILGLDIGSRSIGWALIDKDYHKHFHLLRALPRSWLRFETGDG